MTIPHKHLSDSRRGGFTLLEMLLVMAIIAILTVLSIGSFDVARAHALTAGGNEVAAIATMARQNSLTRNAYTVIVIKTQGAGAYSAYCVLELKRQDDGSYPAAWTTISPWRYLAAGVFFSTDTLTPTNFMASSGAAPLALPTSYPFQGQQIDLTSGDIFQVYQPDGTLSVGQAVVLRLVRGSLTGSTVTMVGTNYYNIVFVRDTGQTKIQRL